MVETETLDVPRLRGHGTERKYRKVLRSSLTDFGVVTEKKQASIQTIFSLWNALSGAGAISYPWGFSQAGVFMGLAVLLVSPLSSLFTSFVTLDLSYGELEFSIMIYKYLGYKMQVFALFISLFSVASTACQAFSVLNSVFFYTIGAFNDWSTGHKLTFGTITLSEFSSTYTAIMIGVAMLALSLMKKPELLMKIVSYGVICSITVYSFVTAYGIYGMSKHYDKLVFSGDAHGDQIKVELFYSSGWSKCAAIFVQGFITQNMLYAFFKNQRNPENNKRDLSIAFLLTTLGYAIAATFGYIGWQAMFPNDIQQNCINNLEYTNPIAFIVRLGIMFQTCSVIPLFLYVIRTQLFGFFLNTEWPGFKHVFILNFLIILACTLINLFFPNQLGLIIDYSATVCGIFITFFFPLACVAVIDMRRYKGKPITNIAPLSDDLMDSPVNDGYDEEDTEELKALRANPNSDPISSAKLFRNLLFYAFIFTIGFCLLYFQFILKQETALYPSGISMDETMNRHL